MREIKFRCWFPKMGRFLDKSDDILDGLINLSNGKRVFNIDDYLNKEIREIDYFSDDGYVLNQYTGLKDKNGVEIYEGDIVIEKSYPFYGNAPEITNSNQKCDELNYIGVIVWDDGYYVDLKVVSDRVIGSAMGYSLYDYEEIEVIGNIYENPELLKEGI